MTNKYLCEIYENVKVKNTNEPEFYRQSMKYLIQLNHLLMKMMQLKKWNRRTVCRSRKNNYFPCSMDR